MRNSNVTFKTVTEFKQAIQASESPAQFVKNPNTGKLFVNIAGKNFKAQQDIDKSKPIAVLIEDGVIENACFVNVSNDTNANVLFTL